VLAHLVLIFPVSLASPLKFQMVST
jgi:hypothetical protein